MRIRVCSPATFAPPSVSRKPSPRLPAARARSARLGEVMVQTSFPEHPLLTRLIAAGYAAFAAIALEERRAAHWPPYSRLALLRAEAKDTVRLEPLSRGRGGLCAAYAFAGECARPRHGDDCPPRRSLSRALLIESPSRAPLQRFLSRWLPVSRAAAGAARIALVDRRRSAGSGLGARISGGLG